MDTKDLKELVKVGNVDAQFELAMLLDDRADGNERQVLELLTKAATAGKPEAQYKLALKLDKAHGESRDNSVEICRWLRNASDQGFCPAVYQLACCYELGFGVDRDVERAALLFRRAAQLGDKRAPARYVSLQRFLDSTVDEVEGILGLLEESASAGDAESALLLSNMYRKGQGVTQNDQKALEWLEFAAQLDDASANQLLAIVYSKGLLGAHSDREKARKLREKSEQLHKSESKKSIAELERLYQRRENIRD